jgi:glycerophosphoryl diester phosphodiesterase
VHPPVVSWAEPELPIVAAHRGLSAEQPENTLAAFSAAVEAGFPSLELDLRATGDGEVVVFHDPGLARTTNGSGRIGEMPYDELRGYTTAAGPVPRFDDVLTRFAGSGRLWNMETKVLAAVAPALDLVEHHNVVRQTLHMSFQPAQLERSRDLRPDLARGYLLSHPVNAEALRRAKELGCSWIVSEETTWTQTRVERVRNAGFHAGAYTVNDPKRALQLVKWGLGCVITDHRQVLHAVQRKVEVVVA